MLLSGKLSSISMKKSNKLCPYMAVYGIFIHLRCDCIALWCTQLSILINLALIRCDIQTKIYEHHHRVWWVEAISFTHCLNMEHIEVSHTLTYLLRIRINEILKRYFSFDREPYPFVQCAFFWYWKRHGPTTQYPIIGPLANSNRIVYTDFVFVFSHHFLPLYLSVIERSSKIFWGSIFHCTDFSNISQYHFCLIWNRFSELACFNFKGNGETNERLGDGKGEKNIGKRNQNTKCSSFFRARWQFTEQ